MFKYSFLIIFCFLSNFAMELTPEQIRLKAEQEKFHHEIDEFPSKPRSEADTAKMLNKSTTLSTQQRKANNDAAAKGLSSIDQLIEEQRKRNEHAIAIGAMLEDATTPDEFDAIVNQMVSPTANKLQ